MSKHDWWTLKDLPDLWDCWRCWWSNRFLPITISMLSSLLWNQVHGAAFIMTSDAQDWSSGKSFIPLIMGFDAMCQLFWLLTAIESRSSRMITILINPLMSCSARLPIYIYFLCAFSQSMPALHYFQFICLEFFCTVIMSKIIPQIMFPKTPHL